MEAYNQAKTGGRKIKQGTTGTFADPDSFTNITREQALANNWEVSNEIAVTITPTKFKEAWNDVRREFTTVKDADSSELFKKLSARLLRG